LSLLLIVINAHIFKYADKNATISTVLHYAGNSK